MSLREHEAAAAATLRECRAALAAHGSTVICEATGIREATRDVLIEPVYDREKHPFSTPPAKIGEDDAMLELFGDVFASSLLDDQPIFDAAAVRNLFRELPECAPEQRVGVDGLMNRVLSLTLMHQRFGMSS